jgi:hypothetical protein
MKLSAQTVDILENFASINAGLLVKPGNVLKTISANKAVLASATIDETFERGFGIYDLNKVLAVLSLHEGAEVQLTEENLVFSGVAGRSKVRIRYTDPKLIIAPPEKELNLSNPDVKVSITEEDLKWIDKIGSILKCPYFVISNDGKQIFLSAMDVKGEVVDDGALEIGTLEDETPFRFVLKVENLKIIPGSYEVGLSARGISQFKHEKLPVKYFVAIEQAHSKYGQK